MSVDQFLAGEPLESCRRISFDSYEILESAPPMLVVRGEAPCANMEIFLQPRIYVRCPEFWGIEIAGCLPGGICLTSIKPFQVSISLGGIVGSEGIEIIGSNKTERVKVGGGCTTLRPDIAVSA